MTNDRQNWMRSELAKLVAEYHRTPDPNLERTGTETSGVSGGHNRVLRRWPTEGGDDVLIVAQRDRCPDATNFRVWAVLESAFNGSAPPLSSQGVNMGCLPYSHPTSKARVEWFIMWCNDHLPKPAARPLGDRRRPLPNRRPDRGESRAAE